MRDVRTQLDAAKAHYRSAKYPGDLAGELLPAPPRRWYLTVQPWLTPIAGGAIAAMVILAVWKPSQDDRGRNRPAPTPITPPPAVVSVPQPQPWRQTVESLRSVPVQTYVMDVKSGVRQAVGRMAVDVDGTLDSKLVADTTQTARQVAGELEQVAKDIGSQLFPRPQ